MSSISPKNGVLVLDNIRSVHNVGAIFRTADAAGISKIFLCGVTPGPVDRFGRERGDFAKAALGAQKTVPSEHMPETAPLVKKLKEEGYFIVCLEQSAKAVDYKSVSPVFPMALLLGNETGGISPEVLKLADVIAEIPMRGHKESLNVSVAGGIALYRLLNL